LSRLSPGATVARSGKEDCDGSKNNKRLVAPNYKLPIWTHDYPIWASTAKSLGLPVNTNMPDRVFQPLKLYPQPVRMQSGGVVVEYLPVERRNQPQSSLSCSKQFRGSQART
jgi:hypothetical protein